MANKKMLCTVMKDNQFYVQGEIRALPKGTSYLITPRNDIGQVYRDDIERFIGKRFGSWMGAPCLQSNSSWRVEEIK